MGATRLQKFLLHIAAWAVYLLLYTTLWREQALNFEEALIRQLWLLPPKLFLVYVSLAVLAPRFLLTHRYTVFLSALLLLSLTGGLINQLMVHFVIPSAVHVMSADEAFWDFGRISKRLTYLNSPLLFALTAEGIRMWYEQKEINARLTKEKLSAELALLKSQLQPHFFFNTLNNLYSLTLQKSELAPQLILRLSDMMRYILNDAQKDLVPLTNEIEFVQGYIDIEQIRYAGKVDVKIQWPESTHGHTLPPLTLFTFVENAFKHGVANEVDRAWIDIQLSATPNQMALKVRNSCPEPGSKSKSTEGIGLRNTEERLRIIYGSALDFSVDRSGSIFEASIVIHDPMHHR